MTKFLRTTLFALLAGASLQAAATDTVTNVQLHNYETDVGLTGGVLGTSHMNGVYAGQIVLTTNDLGTLGVWCVDLLHDIYLGGQYTFAAASQLTTNNLDGAANVVLTSAQIKGISEAAAFGNALLPALTPNANSTALTNAYASDLASFKSANLTGFNALSGNLNAFSAAVQATIWGIEYGTTASGSSQFNADMGIISGGLSNFSNISGEQLNLGTGVQKQFLALTVDATSLSNHSATPVPESNTYGLLALGMGLVGLLAGKRKS